MTISIKRYRTIREWTEGILYADGQRICDTLENSESCLPEGEYQVTLIKCKQYARKMICLNKASPCDQCPKQKFICNNSTLPCYCPMIKPGNGTHNRHDGSILVGTRACTGCLIHPKDAFDALYDRIRKNDERGNTIPILITTDTSLINPVYTTSV